MSTVRLTVPVGLALVLFALPFHARQRSIDDFFTEFSAAWVRLNPNTAVATALGDRPSIRDFHSVLLSSGMLPLHMLERQADAYIARVRDSGR